jgi:outer membrane lipoprotein
LKSLFIFALFSIALVTACTPFPHKLLREATPAVSLPDVQKDPDLYKGKVVIWGGIILETLNREKETVIKVIQTDLDFQKRPINVDKSLGRFIVRYKGFLDPYIFDKGREVTVAGIIIGKEEQTIGEILYVYPVVDSQGVHLWEKSREIMYDDPWFWGPPYPWGYPHPWPLRHRRWR